MILYQLTHSVKLLVEFASVVVQRVDQCAPVISLLNPIFSRESFVEHVYMCLLIFDLHVKIVEPLSHGVIRFCQLFNFPFQLMNLI